MPTSRNFRRRTFKVQSDNPVSRPIVSRPMARHCTQVSQSKSAPSDMALENSMACTWAASGAAQTAATRRAIFWKFVSTQFSVVSKFQPPTDTSCVCWGLSTQKPCQQRWQKYGFYFICFFAIWCAARPAAIPVIIGWRCMKPCPCVFAI
jgi:hypothetical protein